MNAESFKEKYLPIASKLYQIAYQLLENQADAQDMVQEVYLKLWNKRGELNEVKNAEAFSVALLKNMCVDILRSGRYCRIRQTEDINTVPERTNEEEARIHEDAALVHLLIEKLPAPQRRIIILRDIDGYTYDEIEKITALNVINIRVLLSRARKKIREQFKTIDNEQGNRN